MKERRCENVLFIFRTKSLLTLFCSQRLLDCIIQPPSSYAIPGNLQGFLLLCSRDQRAHDTRNASRQWGRCFATGESPQPAESGKSFDGALSGTVQTVPQSAARPSVPLIGTAQRSSATTIAPSCAPLGAQAQAEGAKASKNCSMTIAFSRIER